jgi:AcrR family transcriptional regulator
MAKSVERKRTYNTGLRQEQAQMTKNRILDAASQLFVKNGYSSVTVEDIALEAGVAHQTVYAVFRTKLAVAQTIIWSSFQTEGINELMAQARESSSVEALIRTGYISPAGSTSVSR